VSCGSVTAASGYPIAGPLEARPVSRQKQSRQSARTGASDQAHSRAAALACGRARRRIVTVLIGRRCVIDRAVGDQIGAGGAKLFEEDVPECPSVTAWCMTMLSR